MKYTIFTEGKWDKSFIEDYIKSLFGEQQYSTLDISYNTTGGWTNLKNVVPLFEETTDVGGLNLLIFDADFLYTNGGFASRKEALVSKGTDLHISFELFLFPNNSEDGEFENLLEAIIPDNNKCVIECFNGFENCIIGHNQQNPNANYNVPIQKSKIFAYIDVVAEPKEFELGKKNCNMCYSNPSYWNFEQPYLKPLEAFIRTHIIP